MELYYGVLYLCELDRRKWWRCFVDLDVYRVGGVAVCVFIFCGYVVGRSIDDR